jgi:serine/threonine protein phosphatase 1
VALESATIEMIETQNPLTPGPARLIAIGDIHGCSAALNAILESIAPRPEDTIVTLGDHLDRGPDSRGVVNLLIALAQRCRLIPLQGNHEEMLFAAMEGRSDFDYWMKFGGDRTLDSYRDPGGWHGIPREHLAFLRACLPYHETDRHIFVHANYYPNLPMSGQPNTALLWEPVNLTLMVPHFSQKTVIAGHTPQAGGHILDLGFFKCLDTSCGHGGLLTAMEVNTGQVWQVDEQGKTPA